MVQKLSDSFEFGFRLLIITARKRYMSGKDLGRHRAGCCKTQRTPYATVSDKAGTSHLSSSFVSTVESPDTQRINDLEALFREHYDRVFRAAHRVTGNPEDAEDVLQTVFTRLAGAQGATFERSENPEAYLSRAAI